MREFIVDIYKSILGNVEAMSSAYRYQKNELVVLCMHSTPADRQGDFVRISEFLLSKFQPFDARRIDQYYSHPELFTEGPYLLFTFDDGLKNNFHSAKWLASKGVSAIYFVVPAFIESSDSENYYRTHIRPIVDEQIDHEKEDRTPMSYADLKELQGMGHVIGSHTYGHTLQASMTDAECDEELKKGKEHLQTHLNFTPTSFASPNNSMLSVKPYTAAKIKQLFPFHFTTFPGYNAQERNPQNIMRRNIEVHWPMGKIHFAMGQRDMRRWINVQEEYKARMPH